MKRAAAPNDDFPARVRSSMSRRAPGERAIGLAVSGGADSVAMLAALAESDDLRLVVLHVDHAMRERSGDDAAFVERIAEQFQLPFDMRRVDVPAVAGARRHNVEAVAREVRYSALTSMAKRWRLDVVATAHTVDDQAETVLMQVLRGTVRPAGIRPRSGGIVRPMLEVARAEIRAWLRSRSIEWREDPTNDDRSRERSWVRHHVLPLLESRRPGTARRLARLAGTQADVASFLREEVDRRFGRRPLRRSALVAVHGAVQREALAQRVQQAGGSPHQDHLDLALNALADGSVTQVDLPGPVRLRLRRDVVDVVSVSSGRSDDPPRQDGATDADTDEAWMARALELARQAASEGEVPVGAVVVVDGRVVGEGRNARETTGDPTRHAELEALRTAAEATGSWRLSDATLYVTLEPCPMCAGAILQTQLKRVVFGAYNARDGAFGTVTDLAAVAWKRVPIIEGGVAERTCRRPLERFFRERRARRLARQES